MKLLQTFIAVAISLFMFLSCSTKTNPVYTLTTSTDPAASGIVTPSEGGFDEGSEVEIAAAANDNMVFSGWRGDYTGSENPTVITMNSDKNIVAFFVDRRYPLSIHIEGEGTVTERVLQEKSTEYAPGTFVELTAHPAEGWKLVEWRGDLSGSENPAGIRMDDAREVTAVFEKREYPLFISIEGEGSVEEHIIQEKSTDYENGTLVELTAHAADGWVFSGWEGGLEGNENPETIIIEQETDVTAIFKHVDEILALAVQGEGTVDIEQIESDENPSKTGVQLTARPAEGWRFAEWQGDVKGSDNPVQITLNEEKSVNAVFEIRKYPLTIQTEGEGTVAEQVVQEKTTDYEDGTVVELTANAAQGWEFIEWQGDLSGSENPKQITIDSPKEVTAVFAEESEESTFNLDVNVEGEGSVNLDPEQDEYESGTMVELTATPSDGWEFVEWTGDVNSAQSSVELMMDSNKEVTAIFAEESEENTFNLDVNVAGEGSVNLDPEQDEYESGTTVELTATPSDGWEFMEWTGDVSSSQTSVEITMDSNKEVTAVFAEESEESTYSLAFNIEGDGSVNINPEQDEYESGTMVELTATPSDGWEFMEWTGDVNSAQTSVEITMDSNKEVTAVFTEEAEENTFNLDVNVEGEGSVNIDPEQDEYEDGTMVELTATPSDGWEFDQWEGDLSGTENPTSITMVSSAEITALFIEQETAFSGGDGSSGNPYQVSTAEQLQAISEFLSSHFIQINNINAGSTSRWNGGQGFSPIGSSSNPFTGTFNGNGFEISGLTIDRDDDDHVGLFGFTGNAQINNVGLVNVNIIGEENVGGLAGTNNGRISNSYITGNVTGDELVGGLVGANGNNARIVNSYSRGSVSGDEEVGGLAGRNWPKGVIATSYASGRVSGDDDDTGGFIGRNQASLDSCYWDNQATNQSNGIGEGNQNGLTGLTTSEMTGSSAEDNMPGFDWNSVWRTSSNYPVLQ